MAGKIELLIQRVWLKQGKISIMISKIPRWHQLLIQGHRGVRRFSNLLITQILEISFKLVLARIILYRGISHIQVHMQEEIHLKLFLGDRI